MTTTTWNDVQSRAAVPGSAILTRWKAEQEAKRAGSVRNVTYSEDVMSAFGVTQAAAGVSVTPTSAMRVSAVFACVRLIAGAIGTMPLHVYRSNGGNRERVDDPLWWLLNEQPTPNFTAIAHWERKVTEALLRGDGYTFIGRDAMGRPRELIPLAWGSVYAQLENNGKADTIKYFVRDGDRTYGVDASDMLHFAGFGFDGLKSMSVIEWAGRNAAGNAMAMDEYSGKFFANGAHHSIVLEAPGQMKADTITNLQTAFAAKYSGLENAHRLPLVLTDNIKSKEVSITAEDSQLLEGRKFQVIDIARAFGVPPHMIGETSASTSWGSGIEQMARAFVTYTLQPHLVRFEQELNRKLFKTAGRFVEFNRDALMQGDSDAESNYFKTALGGPGSGPGWMSVDEVRKLKNQPPLGGRSATPFDPRDVATPAEPSTNQGETP
jgi:HK97 family phage portal protein